jgi:two-component system, NarL family, sensor histidine kinase YdfH
VLILSTVYGDDGFISTELLGRKPIVHSYTVRSNNSGFRKPVYNVNKMQNRSSTHLQQVDRDPRLFVAILTMVVVAMTILSIINEPTLRQPLTFIIYILLISVHLVLHWLLEKISERSTKWITWYIIIQGLLAFIIILIANTAGMVFALFMGLIGEGVGLVGLNRWGLLTLTYYLLLSLIGFVYTVGSSSVVGWALVTVPIVLFIVIYVTLYVRQTEARAQAQALLVELEKANKQLSEYADRVEDLTIANERQRMARELHDTLSQGLAGLILQLEAADANLANNHPEKARSIIQQSMGNARTALEEARQAIDDLRQPELVSLTEALNLESHRFTNMTGIPCEMHFTLSMAVSDTIRESIIRSVAEAFNNIARYADASQVTLDAINKEGTLVISIKDNGRGFDSNHIPAGHYGILGIRERINLIGGKLEIESSPGVGTTLTINIPLDIDIQVQ